MNGWIFLPKIKNKNKSISQNTVLDFEKQPFFVVLVTGLVVVD